MNEQTESAIADTQAIIEQAKQITTSFRELEQILLEANRAITLFSATLYQFCQALDGVECGSDSSADWVIRNRMAR